MVFGSRCFILILFRMSLQEQVRYFQYMRPRYSNPSYASGNVGASLGMMYSPDYIKNKSLVKNYTDIPQPQQSNPPQKRAESPKQSNLHRRSRSNLSNYGTSSLGKLPKLINQRDIYQKQEKKYNIITILPKQYNETIKKYPKYRLENMDQNYYKKLKLEEEYNPKNFTLEANERAMVNPEQKTSSEVQRRLNEKLSFEMQNNQKSQKGFRPKMLNNIDELGGVL